MNRIFRMFLFVICISAAIPAFHPPAAAAAEIEWLHSYSAAIAKATAEHKMILSDLVADWCGWCKVMDTDTWGKPSVIELSSKYVFLRLDVEKDQDGIAIARKFKINSLPTVLLLTSGGDEFERFIDYLPAQEFLDKLKAALADPESLGNLRIAQGREPENLEARFKLAYALFERSNYRDAEDHFAQIVQKDPENKSRHTDASIFYLAACKADRNDVAGCLAAIEKLRKEFPESNVVPVSFLLAGQALLHEGKRPEAREQVQEFIKKYPTHPLMGKARELLAAIGNQ